MPAIKRIAHKNSLEYPKQFITIGDHLTARRLEFNITKTKAAKMMGVDNKSYWSWERNEIDSIAYNSWPKIIIFLGYCPYQPCNTINQKVAMFRKLKGLTMVKLAKNIGIKRSDFSRFESGEKIKASTFNKIRKYYLENI